MELEYFDLLSGDSVFMAGIGHIRPIKLYDIMSTKGIGIKRYNQMINILALMQKKQDDSDNIRLSLYINTPLFKEIVINSLSFFMEEKLEIKGNEIVCYDKINNKIIGVINDKNYKEIVEIIFKLNCVKYEKKETTKSKNKKDEDVWNKVEEHFKNNKLEDKENIYDFGNVISKICVMNNSYDLTNVFNLTVYQLYDQFNQISYLKFNELKERIYSIHGDKEYKFEDWLKKFKIGEIKYDI